VALAAAQTAQGRRTRALSKDPSVEKHFHRLPDGLELQKTGCIVEDLDVAMRELLDKMKAPHAAMNPNRMMGWDEFEKRALVRAIPPWN
jgi:hypothetical protein